MLYLSAWIKLTCFKTMLLNFIKLKLIVDMAWSLFLKQTEVVGDNDDNTICSNLGYPTENL